MTLRKTAGCPDASERRLPGLEGGRPCNPGAR
jgi:hypothetical protein